ncbi:hypothetical protein ACFXO9_12540 [Nocardia tengchongensis]|uniref:hypothetical protein n=1 Tax=Nocardia tengchongensis TaxID=2055889 RepID=UPI00368FE091
MGIRIAFQNMNHQPVEMVSGFDQSKLHELIEAATAGSLLDGIQRQSDTMYNSYQLEFLLAELSAIRAEGTGGQEVVSVLRRAAETAIRRHGYLWFSAD